MATYVVTSGQTLTSVSIGSAGQVYSEVTVEAGGATSGISVFAGGVETVTSGGVASGSVVSSGGIQAVSGGADTSSFIGTGGGEVVLAGGSASGTVVSAGTLTASSGGTTTDILVSGAGLESVFAGAVTSGTHLTDNGAELVYGTASGPIADNGGAVFVYGTASGSVVNSGGIQFVSSGGVANSTTVSLFGDDVVANGGMAEGTELIGGVETVSSGGVAQATVIGYLGSGGVQNVYPGGTAVATIVSASGLQNVSSGGITQGTKVFGGEETVSSGGVASMTTVFSGYLNIASGGSSINAVVGNGTESVSAGGVASATTLGSDGAEEVYGTASGTIVSSGGLEAVMGGGVASGTTVADGGSQTAGGGGTAFVTTVNSGGSQTVNDGGVTSGTIINGGGSATLDAGGVASGTMVNSGGSEIVGGGGVTVGTTVNSGGFEVISAGGVASDTVLYTSGFETVSAGGTASGTIVSGGVQIIRGGSDTTSSGGGTPVGSSSGGSPPTGTPVAAAADDGPNEGALGSGLATPTADGGTAIGTFVTSGGTEFVYSGGIAIDTVVSRGGLEVVSSGGITSDTTVADGGILQILSGGVTSGSIMLTDIGATVTIEGAVMPTATISGFAVGDDIDLTTVTFDARGTVSDDIQAGTLTVVEDNVSYVLQFAGDYSDTVFELAAGPSGGTMVTAENAAEPPCYCRGTRIATERGEVAVEDLAIGDMVTIATGGARPVVWLGHRRLDLTRHPRPEAVWPLCVQAGAFRDGVPSRDVWLSPGHSVATDGVLTPISRLQNGRTIAQVQCPTVEYWHVELDAHDVILAEGLATESYLDGGNRTAFTNGGAFLEAHPDFVPKHWSETCLPLVFDGPEVARARVELLARAKGFGHAVTSDSAMHVMADGNRIEPIALGPACFAFVVPAGCVSIALRSRTFVPAHVLVPSNDFRSLGLCIRRLQIDGDDIALDDEPRFESGWHAFEADVSHPGQRWTTGGAALPAGTQFILLDLAHAGYYWAEPKHEVAALFG